MFKGILTGIGKSVLPRKEAENVTEPLPTADKVPAQETKKVAPAKPEPKYDERVKLIKLTESPFGDTIQLDLDELMKETGAKNIKVKYGKSTVVLGGNGISSKSVIIGGGNVSICSSDGSINIGNNNVFGDDDDDEDDDDDDSKTIEMGSNGIIIKKKNKTIRMDGNGIRIKKN